MAEGLAQNDLLAEENLTHLAGVTIFSYILQQFLSIKTNKGSTWHNTNRRKNVFGLLHAARSGTTHANHK